MQLEITVTEDGYRLVGELDMATCDGLTELLRSASAGHHPVVLDFSGVSFMDSSGLRALLDRKSTRLNSSHSSPSRMPSSA